MVKLVISLLLVFFPLYSSADVSIYKDDFTLVGIEKHSGETNHLTSTLYGGSSDLGERSPADCIIKLEITKSRNGALASLLPFDSEMMNYSSPEKDIAHFYAVDDRVELFFENPLDVCPLETNFSKRYVIVNKHSKEFDASFNTLLKINYYNAMAFFQSGDVEQAINSLEPYLTMSDIDRFYSEPIYNDYGYFLQENGRYKESIYYLEIVKRRSPHRKAVYLNLADAFWALKDLDNAKLNYKQYLNLMKSSGYEKHVPSRVQERIK
ncbi:M48 family metallopeptidase [Lonsdalea britannica]|uniref:tetratricopeptide repeat protein n=1 Tax=Lonsdalea britannica TaxID=1082704 RepID=UPI0026EAA4A9|nr:tetratricopeptide repeat protein [Lonsdalea britannica]